MFGYCVAHSVPLFGSCSETRQSFETERDGNGCLAIWRGNSEGVCEKVRE
jgi:hypothetical protein